MMFYVKPAPPREYGAHNLRISEVKHFLNVCIRVMCIYLVSITVSAQNQGSGTSVTAHADSLRNRQLDQIVVTGTGTHSKAQNAVVPVQVITADDLQRLHVTNLEDALRQLTPGITSMTNGMGTTMMMNGLNEDYILILENGKRLTGDDRYTRINMANVKRIEVLSGAGSALYGSEAIGGVINIITNLSPGPSPKGEGRHSSEGTVDVNITTTREVYAFE